MMSIRPDRKAFEYRVYCDLVIGMKLFFSRKRVCAMVAEARSLSRRFVDAIYGKYIRP